MAKPKDDGEKAKVDLLGQLSVALEGVDYMLRPSRQAISNIERGIGRMRGLAGPVSLTQLTTQCGSLALSIDELGLCVAELMNAYGEFNPDAGASYKGAKPERCADLIYEDGPVEPSHRLAVIFAGALTGGYTASGEVKAAGKTTEPIPTA